MRLLLTSNGLTNDAIARELERLLGDQENRKVAFIPTAVFGEAPGHKGWFFEQITNFQKFGYGLDYLDVVDPSADEVAWKPRLEQVGIILVGGGNVSYLLDSIERSCDSWLGRRLAQDKVVYVGVSAGSMIIGPSIEGSHLYKDQEWYGPVRPGNPALSWVDFEVLPHLDTELTPQAAAQYTAQCRHKVIALRDQEAVSVNGVQTQLIAG